MSAKEKALQDFASGLTIPEALIKYPEVSKRTIYNWFKMAKDVSQSATIETSEIELQNIAATVETPIAESISTTQLIAKNLCIALVLLLLSASFFTIQEVTSKVFAIASFSGYCIAIAITLTPIAIIFTHGNLYLRICIQVIAFGIEVLCNVVVIAESIEDFESNILNTTGLQTLSFAWIAGIAIPLFALLCTIYLNQIQNNVKHHSP